MIGALTASGGSASTPLHTNGQPPFNPERCLFCNKDSVDLDSSLLHMQTAHGLFIPDRKRLVVDLDVLIKYLHLVIFGYNECIWCGTQRNTPQAAQQHMLGKSHCRFDIAKKESEFSDFYDFSDNPDSDESDSDGEGVVEDTAKENAPAAKREGLLQGTVQPDDTSLRLPSGKIISKNSPSSPRRTVARHRRSVSPAQLGPGAGSDGEASSPTALIPGGRAGGSITKSERRAEAFATAQLARLSANDQRSLAHLPVAQQRSLLATQQKQTEKARRAERRYRSRVEGLDSIIKMGSSCTPGTPSVIARP